MERMRTDNPIVTSTGFVAPALVLAGVGITVDTPFRRRFH